MKTEISRDSHRPKKRYSGVYQQQGRMLTDADWNELVEILKGRLSDALKDVVGNGSPFHRNVINNEGDPSVLQWGYVHIDGIQAEILPRDPSLIGFDYSNQKDFPFAPVPPANHVLYADVWERSVTYLMDDRLRDRGLHGADTCSRKKMVAQVKWCPFDPANPNDHPEQSPKNPPKGDAQLKVTLKKTSTLPDPCDPCEAKLDVESKVGNYLFRVEVHDVVGDADNPTKITLKWSSENGAEQFPAMPTKDEMSVGFITDKWAYEFFNETCEKHLGVHLENTAWKPARGKLAVFNATEGPYAVASLKGPSDQTKFIRRWDGYCILDLSSNDLDEGVDRDVVLSVDKAANAVGHVKITPTSILNIKLSSLKLEMNLDAKKFVAGDYWLVDVREAEDKVDDVLMDWEEPQGIEHHYLTLATMKGGELQPNQEADRKYAFPPLTEMTRLYHVGGDGQEAMPGHFVPQSVKVGVTNGQWPVAGARVEFSVTKGGGSLEEHDDFHLDNVDAANQVGETTTDEKGMAKCNWKLGLLLEGSTQEETINLRKQRVVVKLLDPDYNPADSGSKKYLDHPPVHFYASLSTADQVAFTPDCDGGAPMTVNSLLDGDGSLTWPLFHAVGEDPPHSTVKDVLDTFLCKLRARHIPFYPDDCTDGEPITVKTKLGIDTEISVHEILQKLICQLDADDIPYDPDACVSGVLEPTVMEGLIVDARTTIHEVLQKLLCELRAGIIPYDPNSSAEITSRWRDIKELDGTEDLVEPNTVQEAIDDLIKLLESTDISYEVTNCGTDALPTVRLKLGLLAGPYKIDEIFDKLLCDFKASHLPLDKSIDICSDLSSAKTVQDALKILCDRKAGGGCSITVGTGGKYTTLEEALDTEIKNGNRDIRICLLPETHIVEALVLADELRLYSITITGYGATIIVQEQLSLTAGNLVLKGINFSAIDKKTNGMTGKSYITLSSRGGKDVFIEDCSFYRYFSGTDRQWEPLVRVTGETNLNFLGSRMYAMRPRRKVFDAAKPKKSGLPAESYTAYKKLDALFLMDPYGDSDAFKAEATAVAKEISDLKSETRDKWYDERPKKKIKDLPEKPIRIEMPRARLSGLRLMSEGLDAPSDAVVTDRVERRTFMSKRSPKDEVTKFYENLKLSDATREAVLIDTLIDISKLISVYDFALVLDSNDVGGRITNNDIEGYVGLHFEQRQPRTPSLLWDSTAGGLGKGYKGRWGNDGLKDAFSSKNDLSLHGNNLTSVRSMVTNNVDSTIDVILSLEEGTSIPSIDVESYESMTVRDNFFSGGMNSFISRYMNVSGNQFTTSSVLRSMVYAMGHKGVFLGNQASEDSADIEQIFSSMKEAANLLEVR